MNNQMRESFEAWWDARVPAFKKDRHSTEFAYQIWEAAIASQTCVAKPELPQPMKMLSMELRGVIIDTEQGHGFDAICLETVKRVHDQISAYSTAPTVELPEGLVAYERSSHCITYTEDDLRAYGDECARAALSASTAPQPSQIRECNTQGPLLIARIKRYKTVFGCSTAEAKDACEHDRDLNSDKTEFVHPISAIAAKNGADHA